MCLCIMCMPGTHRGQKKVSDHLELEIKKHEHAYRKHKNTGFLEAKCSKPLKHLSSLIPLKQKTSYYKCEWGSLCKGCKCQQMPKSQKLWVSSNWGCELPEVVPRVQIQVLVKGKQCILSAAEPSSQPLCFFFHGRIHL